MSGTPKTLHDAIRNGIHDVGYVNGPEERVEQHVRDFLAQKFGTAFIEADLTSSRILKSLWLAISGEKIE